MTCPEDLTDFPWLQELGTNEVSNWLHKHGVNKTRAGGLLEMPGTLLLDRLRNGNGVAVTVSEWVRQDLEAGRLQELFRDVEGKGYYLVTRPDALRPSAQKFITWALREARTAEGARQKE